MSLRQLLSLDNDASETGLHARGPYLLTPLTPLAAVNAYRCVIGARRVDYCLELACVDSNLPDPWRLVAFRAPGGQGNYMLLSREAVEADPAWLTNLEALRAEPLRMPKLDYWRVSALVQDVWKLPNSRAAALVALNDLFGDQFEKGGHRSHQSA